MGIALNRGSVPNDRLQIPKNKGRADVFAHQLAFISRLGAAYPRSLSLSSHAVSSCILTDQVLNGNGLHSWLQEY